MVAILRLLIGTLRNCIMSRRRLEAEVIVLRHQLNILRRKSPRRVRPNTFDSGSDWFDRREHRMRESIMRDLQEMARTASRE